MSTIHLLVFGCLAVLAALCPSAAHAQDTSWPEATTQVYVVREIAVPLYDRRSREDPCRDGRYSLGRPSTCLELYRHLYRPDPRYVHRPDYDPCRDGSHSRGVAYDCEKLYQER